MDGRQDVGSLGNLTMNQMMVDEYGNPYVVLEEQSRRKRTTGLEAHKQNIIAAKAVAETVRTSLGPKGIQFPPTGGGAI